MWGGYRCPRSVYTVTILIIYTLFTTSILVVFSTYYSTTLTMASSDAWLNYHVSIFLTFQHVLKTHSKNSSFQVLIKCYTSM